jgi:phospholipid/cholesterol/gamma-HCH transport system substrate-binding protein
METRADYIVTGAFTLAVIVGVFGFIYWFQNSFGGGERLIPILTLSNPWLPSRGVRWT